MNREIAIGWVWLSGLLAGEAQVSRPLRRDADLSALNGEGSASYGSGDRDGKGSPGEFSSPSCHVPK